MAQIQVHLINHCSALTSSNSRTCLWHKPLLYVNDETSSMHSKRPAPTGEQNLCMPNCGLSNFDIRELESLENRGSQMQEIHNQACKITHSHILTSPTESIVLVFLLDNFFNLFDPNQGLDLRFPPCLKDSCLKLDVLNSRTREDSR